MNSAMESESKTPQNNENRVEDIIAGKVSKLGICEVCRGHEAKYTCPRCEVKTCSLVCNKIHKNEVECNGLRDRAKFIPLKKFSNIDLSNDYRFLEEVIRTVEVAKKNVLVKNRNRIPHRLIRLQKAALERKICLKFLPDTFVRHKNNTTNFFAKSNTIEWQIDWVFANSDNYKITEKKISESLRLASILHKYLIRQEETDIQEKLQYYQAVDIPGMRLLLKAEQKKGKRFYELDPTCTLRECLRRKIIIENPIIHVVLKDCAGAYDIVDSDDEDDGTFSTKSGIDVINNILKKSESDESIYKSLKNLLFISEYSDDDGEGMN